MRFAFGFVLLSSLCVLADDETPVVVPKEPAARFGVPSKSKVYPQTSPKRVLESAVEACNKEDYAYLLAHLLDPMFVDLRVVERAKPLEAQTEVDLIKLRDFQYANPDRFPSDRVPLDKPGFAAAVTTTSRELAFKQLVRDVQEKLRDDPEALRDLRKILRDGTFTDEAMGAKAIHPTVKDRSLFFKRIGDRWFLENRLEEAAKKEP